MIPLWVTKTESKDQSKYIEYITRYAVDNSPLEPLTYLLNYALQSFSRDYNLASPLTQVTFVNLSQGGNYTSTLTVNNKC